MPSEPIYRVQVREFADTTDYGPGDLIAEFENAKNIGWSKFINDVPMAFFTINQEDPKARVIRDYLGRCHVAIYRDDDLVWTGWGGMELDANSDDAIIYCYGYAAGMFWTHTPWDKTWTSQTVATIVAEAWGYATAHWGDSRLGFVSQGTIQSPYTTAGGPTEITLPTYSAFYKRVLFLMQEMAALGASDTGQSTMFEITDSLTAPTFRFLRDRSTDLTTVRWEWDSGKVRTFQMYEMPVYHRNEVLAVGSLPRNLIARTEDSDASDIDAWGRMQESLFLPWVRDETELERVTALRLQRGIHHDRQPYLSFYPGAETPPGTADSLWALGDTVPVKIDRGATYVDERVQITGVMVAVLEGQEAVRAVVQEPL